MKKTIKKRVGKKEKLCKAGTSCGGCSGCGYFLGFIGTAVYYLQSTTGFWNGFLGLLKALVWPAFLVYEVLKFLAV